MSRYIQLNIIVSDNAVKEMLVATLSAAGANGFEEEKNLLKLFIDEADFDDDAFLPILTQHALPYTTSVIEETNWNAQWEAGFTPVQIGSFCLIRADFHPPVKNVKHDIIITPKMSFGTGHHATTHMMVEAMQGLDIADKTVFDFGTGTGVLAILAEKMSARQITAIDNDDWSINNANENFNSNHCSNVLLFNSETIPEECVYDIILANINRNIILQHLSAIEQHLTPGGVVLLSGLLTGDRQLILEQALQHKLALEREFEMNGWICLLMVNRQ